MNRSPGVPSLNVVARQAGVSAMTVSRVLRHSPRVSPQTREKVRRALSELRYHPDPRLARLMTLVRSRKGRGIGAALAVVRDDAEPVSSLGAAYQYVSVDDIRRRARQHGYEVEEFFLGREGLTARRLESILRARGIEGVIVSPQSPLGQGAQLRYKGLAAATFGYGLSSPALHRASTNMTQGILQTTARLALRGYARIGLAITRWIDARADFTYSGAMLHYQQSIPARQRVPLLLFPEDDLRRGEEVFCRWMWRWRPDVIISFHRQVPDWLRDKLKLRVPQDVGLVVHDWTPSMPGLAGIDHRRAAVAAAAVDLVVHQLLQNESGVPEVPHQTLIPPLWREGESVRRARA